MPETAVSQTISPGRTIVGGTWLTLQRVLLVHVAWVSTGINWELHQIS
ncbi:hypothetical protein H7F15_10490 [Pontibacter sp. Tf4]|nr:hypothetical protein [Pontibacter sp. Tf4]MBB6611464.1 hypothetical protein [Pontibacter sp. Tf4]